MTQDSQDDFKVALVLLVIAISLLVHTLGFPMSGSYAGVENQWFASPALFPLIIISLLLLCSCVLLVKAIRLKGFKHFADIKTWLGDWQQDRVKDRWYIIFNLLVFVYIYIPSIDFYLASILFLISLTSRFYYQSAHCLSRLPLLHLILSIVLISIKLNINSFDETSWLSVNQDELVISYSDLAAGTAIIIIFALNWFMPEVKNFKRARTQTLVVLFVPLILVLVFTFLLFVPMPVEYGTVSNFLSYLAYDVLSIY